MVMIAIIITLLAIAVLLLMLSVVFDSEQLAAWAWLFVCLMVLTIIGTAAFAAWWAVFA